MRDMNFFNEFLQQKVKAKQSFFIASVAVIVFFGALLGVYFVFFMQYKFLNDKYLDLEAKLLLPKYAEARVQIAEAEAKLAALNNYLSTLESLDEKISALHKVTAEENYKISRCFPEHTYMTSYSIKERILEIEAIAFSLDEVPALTQNLRDSGLFSYVGPPSGASLERIYDGDYRWDDGLDETFELYDSSEQDAGEFKAAYKFTVQAYFE